MKSSRRSSWLEKAANRLVDKKWIANEKENIKRETRPYGENFEAVVTFKLYCDNQDELLIHKVNDRRGNPDFPSFVFKTSKERMKIALNMDREGEHFMREVILLLRWESKEMSQLRDFDC